MTGVMVFVQMVILSVGKLKEKYLLDAQTEYVKRIRLYGRIEIKELPGKSFGENDSKRSLELVKEKEGQKILKTLRPDSFVIALDRNGEEVDSLGLAEKIEKLGLKGRSHITFIIGGSLGLSKQVIKRANWKLSFSCLTFTHQLIRILLLEQIFRTFKIIRNEPYHR